jgi:thiamine biosynthesis lipoprotein
VSPTAVASGSRVTSAIYMDTLVTIEVARRQRGTDGAELIENAFRWFAYVEKLCSRFDKDSELSRLSASSCGEPVIVSPMLFELITFACAVARKTEGAFDPTVGRAMEKRGFDQNYVTGERTASPRDTTAHADYRDVVLDHAARSVTVTRPLVVDLGAIAKGFAIDLAAKELEPFADFVINAGGDIFARGHHPSGTPWRIGIRHPRELQRAIETLSITDAAVCTSGDYERPDGKGGHHLLDPQTGEPAAGIASATVIAPSAMLADALSTAAFILPPERAIELLESQGVECLIVTADLELHETQGLSRFRP